MCVLNQYSSSSMQYRRKPKACQKPVDVWLVLRHMIRDSMEFLKNMDDNDVDYMETSSGAEY